MTRLDRQIGVESEQLFQQKGVWLLAMTASGILLLWWQTPMLLTLALMTTVILLIMMCVRLPERVSMRSMMVLILLLVACSLALVGLHKQVDSSNLYALLVDGLHWPLLLLISASYLMMNKTKA